MPVTPTEILAVAKRLASFEDSEAFTRSSVSRAYYAAFLAARSTFQASDRIGGESSHSSLIAGVAKYAAGPNPKRLEAGQVARELRRLRAARNTADYEVNLNFEIASQNRAIASAGLVINLSSKISLISGR